jgi:biopolymer transport protein TolR
MAGGAGNDTKGIYEPNMTPLIDVSLVLVVILMVATPMALQSSIALQRQAQSDTPVAAVPPPERRLHIDVESEDRILVNGEVVARSDLRTVLKPRIGAETPVIVRCAADVTHGTFVFVLDEAKQSGAESIAVVGR